MEDFSPATVGQGLTVTHGSDMNLLVEFYRNPANERPYIRINIPGDKTTEIRRPVREEDKQRFPAHWAAFENGQRQILPGHTPIDDVGWLTDAQKSEFKIMSIHSVEQLASVEDASKLGFGGQTWVNKAREHVASKVPANDRLARENADLKERMAAMEAQLASLSKPKNKGGRPRKVRDDTPPEAA